MTTIGILGGGQLGRMLALAGYPLGLWFRCFEPDPNAPAGDLAEHVMGAYADEPALARFAEGLDAVTYEFENVPVEAVRFLQARVPVYPPLEALEASQDRLVEKSFLRDSGVVTPLFYAVDSLADLEHATEQAGFPCVLKTRRMGYDGKGQVVLRSSAGMRAAWESLGGGGLILEGFVAFDCELSLLSVRARNGQIAFYPLVQNHHRDGILRLSLAPAPSLTPDLQAQAEACARRILERLDYVGVLAIEWFQCGDLLIANEMAPRVHNSGHWSIEGAETSQFENHIRAVIGAPLGSTEMRGAAAMVNIIGELPDTEAILAAPGAHLHLYGKSPRPGRKLGHVTVRAEDLPRLMARLEMLRAPLPEAWVTFENGS